ncbi:MAG: hypothetical protein WCO65_01055 [bacterium]
MNSGDAETVSRLEDQLYKITFSDVFWEDVANIRRKFKMPIFGFEKEILKTHWIKGLDANMTEDLFLEQINLAKKYGVSLLDRDFLFDYLYFGDPETRKMKKHEDGAIKRKTKNTIAVLDTDAYKYGSKFQCLDDLYVAVKQPFVKLFIFPEATNYKDVQEFIKENWERIQDSLMEQTQKKPEKMNPLQNKERDEKIYALSRKSRKELDPTCVDQTKEMIIQKILSNEDKIKVSTATIKRVVTEYNKLKNKRF